MIDLRSFRHADDSEFIFSGCFFDESDYPGCERYFFFYQRTMPQVLLINDRSRRLIVNRLIGARKRRVSKRNVIHPERFKIICVG